MLGAADPLPETDGMEAVGGAATLAAADSVGDSPALHAVTVSSRESAATRNLMGQR
jgi:hypothetical protein